MKITIKDIARIAGVSHPSVSKALNNMPGVSDETRNKILAVARRMDYVPNIAARRLADKKTNSIGLVWPQGEGLFFYHLCNRIQKEASKTGVNIIMSMAEPEAALHALNEHFVEMAVVWLNSDYMPSEEILKQNELFQGNILVIGGGRFPRAHRISIDRKNGIYNAVKYLTESGHRQIAYIGEQNEKLVGFMQGHREYNLPYHADYILTVGSSLDIPEIRLAGLLASNDRPTAFIVSCQGVLFQLIRMLRQYQIRIPDDFSLIVYDDIPEMEILDIPLTTVGPSIDRLAAEVLNVYAGNISGARQERWVDLEIIPELKVRQSVRTIAR